MRKVIAALAGLCVLLVASAAPAMPISYNIAADPSPGGWTSTDPAPFGLPFPTDGIKFTGGITVDRTDSPQLVHFSMHTGSKLWTENLIDSSFSPILHFIGDELLDFFIAFKDGTDLMSLGSSPTESILDLRADMDRGGTLNCTQQQCVTFSRVQSGTAVPVPGTLVLLLGSCMAGALVRRYHRILA